MSPKQAAVAHGVADFDIVNIRRCARFLGLKTDSNGWVPSLKGDRAGQQSIRINEQWRICFRWHGQDGFDVEIVDYH